MTDWTKIRNDFPVTRGIKYFMSAAMTPIPKVVLDFITGRYKRFAEAGDIDWHKENESDFLVDWAFLIPRQRCQEFAQ